MLTTASFPFSVWLEMVAALNEAVGVSDAADKRVQRCES